MKTSFTIQQIQYIADIIVCNIHIVDGFIKIGHMYSSINHPQRYLIVQSAENTSSGGVRISVKKTEMSVGDTYSG